MKNNFLFLDIDGVLNTNASRNENEEYFEKPISEEKMPLLKYIVDATDSIIVLTSSYRQYWNEGAQQASEIGKYMNEIFAEYGMKIYSKTMWLPGNKRKKEIEAWLADHQVESYVIIDDVDYGFDEDHFVKTTDDRGLDEEACEKVIKFLKGEDYAESKNAFEEWQQVREIIKDAIGETAFDIWFKKLKTTDYFPESDTLFLSCHSFSRRIIEDSEQFSDVLDRAIRVIFGDDIEYQIEDEDIGENDVDLLLSYDHKTDTVVRKKIACDPYSVYKNPEIRAYKIHEYLRKVFNTKPECIFQSKNVHSELLLRLLLIFMNASELIGITDLIQVSRRGGNYIEIYSNDCTEFLIDKVTTEKHLFRNSDYDRFVIRNYDKKKRYLPTPFYIRSSVNGIGAAEDFFANSDSFFVLFALINMMENVRIESVKGCHYRCVKYERGFNSKGVEEGETNKKNGTYVTYTDPGEDMLKNDEICKILETISLISGVKTSFFYPDKGDMLSYNYKDVGDYLDRYLPSKYESFFSRVKGGGRDRYNDSYYNAKVEVGFQLAQSKGFSKSFYNYSLLPEDNIFTEQVYKILAEKFNDWFEGKIMKRFTAEDIMGNCAIIISVKTDYDYEAWEPMRAESVKARRMLSDMLEDCFNNFSYWIGERDQVELINFAFNIFKARDNDTVDELFPDGMK